MNYKRAAAIARTFLYRPSLPSGSVILPPINRQNTICTSSDAYLWSFNHLPLDYFHQARRFWCTGMLKALCSTGKKSKWQKITMDSCIKRCHSNADNGILIVPGNKVFGVLLLRVLCAPQSRKILRVGCDVDASGWITIHQQTGCECVPK